MWKYNRTKGRSWRKAHFKGKSSRSRKDNNEERAIREDGGDKIGGIWKGDNSMCEMSQLPASSSQTPCRSQENNFKRHHYIWTLRGLQVKKDCKSFRSARLCMLSYFIHVWLFVTLWTVAHQAPLAMGFSRQEYWNGLPCSPPGDLPYPGIKPRSPTLQADSSPSESLGKPRVIISISKGPGPFRGPGGIPHQASTYELSSAIWGPGGIPHQASTYELSSASLPGIVLCGVRDTADAS